MNRSKHQTPNTKEAPKGKHQAANCRHPEWALSTDARDDAFVLRKESPAAPNVRHPFDLEERTAVFGEKIVKFSKKIPRDPTNNRLIDQLVGAGTSVGANYCEANDCVSQNLSLRA